MIQIIPIS